MFVRVKSGNGLLFLQTLGDVAVAQDNDMQELLMSMIQNPQQPADTKALAAKLLNNFVHSIGSTSTKQ